MKEHRKTTLAAAVAGGYLLGRTRQGKLALILASIIAGRKLPLSPHEVIAQGLRKVTDSPQFRQLLDQVSGELLESGRSAARAAADRRMSAYADALRRRTEQLQRPKGESPPEPPEGEEAERGEPERGEPERGEAEHQAPERPDRQEREEEPGPRPPQAAQQAASRKPPRPTPPGRSASPSDQATAKGPSPRTGRRR